ELGLTLSNCEPGSRVCSALFCPPSDETEAGRHARGEPPLNRVSVVAAAGLAPKIIAQEALSYSGIMAGKFLIGSVEAQFPMVEIEEVFFQVHPTQLRKNERAAEDNHNKTGGKKAAIAIGYGAFQACRL